MLIPGLLIPGLLIPGLLIPGPGPVFADDVPVPPNRPVIADGPNKPGEVVVAEGPKADTPDLIVEVNRPCPGAILLVSTATSACVNGVVQISGNEYCYCPSKNEFEVRHYEYTPKPARACGGSGPMTLPGYVLPQGTTPTNDPGVHACVDSKRTIVQWVQGPSYWEKLIWHVYECFDDTTGAKVDRVFPTPDIEVTDVPSSNPDPINAGRLR